MVYDLKRLIRNAPSYEKLLELEHEADRVYWIFGIGFMILYLVAAVKNYYGVALLMGGMLMLTGLKVSHEQKGKVVYARDEWIKKHGEKK